MKSLGWVLLGRENGLLWRCCRSFPGKVLHLQPVLCSCNETAWFVPYWGFSTGFYFWALMVPVALCVEQGPAHQPGCGEVLQAAQLHGQQACHLTLHAGLLHIPVLSQVRMYPGPACTPLFSVLFLSLPPILQFPRWIFVHMGEWSLQRELCLGNTGMCSVGPPNFCESKER